MLLVVMAFSALAQTTSPFNKRILREDSSVYEFIVTGHLHGASTHRSGFPASSLLANIDTLNSIAPLFLISLGDLFLEVTEENIANYRRSFFSKINFPIFNSVGNHDIDKLYESNFGNTWTRFRVGSEAFIILDTEKDNGSISDDQLTFFGNALEEAGSDQSIKNVFIFSHRPVWAENNTRYEGLFSDNTRSTFTNNFESTIKPLLVGMARVKPVYWMSGSLGTAPASFFYDKEEGLHLTFLQTAIRDLPRDAALKVKVNNGQIQLSGISFNGRPLKAIHEYGIEAWKSNTPAEKRFNFRLLPLMIKQTVTHVYFWFGVCFAMILVILISLYSKRRIRKRMEKK